MRPDASRDVADDVVGDDPGGSGAPRDDPGGSGRPSAPVTAAGWWARHWFAAGLGIAAALAAALRAANILVLRPTCAGDVVDAVRAGSFRPPDAGTECFAIWGDSLYGYLQGRLNAEGHWYVGSVDWLLSGGTRYVPSAGDPPLYALFLSVVNRFGGTSGTAVRLASAAVGVAGVVLIGLVARRVAGRRAGLIAAAIAAVYPMLWINDGMLLSESLYVPLLAVAVLAAYRFWDDDTVGNAVLLGVAVAVAALTRAEALLLYPLVVLPLAWGRRRAGAGRMIGRVACCAVAGLAVLAPWLVFNNARFEEPTFMTSGTGAVLLAGSCDTAFEGEYIGYYGANCYDELITAGYVVGDPRLPACDGTAAAVAAVPAGARTAEDVARLAACYPDPLTLDESQRDKISRDVAVRYLRDHTKRVPLVMAARVGRMWDLFQPFQNVRLNADVEGRGRLPSWLGLLAYWALLPLAVGGAVVLWRRRVPVSPLLAMAGLITVTAAVSLGITRYRVPWDLAVVVLAAVAADAVWRRRRAAPDDGTVRRKGGV